MTEFIKLVDSTIRVDISEGAEEAVEALSQDVDRFPEVIFVDVSMPVLDGFAFLERYEERFYPQKKSTRVYMLSSSLRPEDRKRAAEFESVHDFLSKDDIDKTLSQSLYLKEES